MNESSDLSLTFLNHFFKNLFISFGYIGSSLLRVGLSLAAVSGGYSPLRCAGFSLQWLLLLRAEHCL